MRTYSMNDAQDPYEHEEDVMGENIYVGNAETESNGRIFQDTPPYFAATMRILRVEMQSYRVDNERLVKTHEKQNQLNAAMLQILTDIHRWMNFGDQKVVRVVLEEGRYLLVSHMNLKDLLGIQVPLLTRMRRRGITETIHVISLRRQGRLPSMVR